MHACSRATMSWAACPVCCQNTALNPHIKPHGTMRRAPSDLDSSLKSKAATRILNTRKITGKPLYFIRTLESLQNNARTTPRILSRSIHQSPWDQAKPLSTLSRILIQASTPNYSVGKHISFVPILRISMPRALRLSPGILSWYHGQLFCCPVVSLPHLSPGWLP